MLEAIMLLLMAATDQGCLIRQILIEAEAEPLEGKAMVAEVIRERSRRTGLGYCAIIDQPGQFGSRSLQPPPEAILSAIVATAIEPTCSAVHFDVASSRKGWAKNLPVACVVAGHVFYENEKWK